MIREHLPSTLDYLLGQTDCRGRNRPSYIIDGNYDTFMTQLKQMKQKKNQYITICFRDCKSLNELGGAEFLNKFKNDVLELMLPGMDYTQFQYMFVIHDNDKHDFELNFVLLQSVNNKRFYGYYDKFDRKCFMAFDRYIHDKYPQLTDPLVPALKRALVHEEQPWEHQQQGLFEAIDTKVKSYNPPIRNKDQLLEFLHNAGYKVTRIRRNSITVAQGQNSIKLVGALCTDAKKTQGEDLVAQYQSLLSKRQKNLLKKYPLKEFITYEYTYKQSLGYGQREPNPKDTRTAHLSHDNGTKPNVTQVGKRPELRYNVNEGTICRGISRCSSADNGTAGANNRFINAITNAERTIEQASCQATNVHRRLPETKEYNYRYRHELYYIERQNYESGRQNEKPLQDGFSTIIDALDIISNALNQILYPSSRKSIVDSIIDMLDEWLGTEEKDIPQKTIVHKVAKEQTTMCDIPQPPPDADIREKYIAYLLFTNNCDWAKDILYESPHKYQEYQSDVFVAAKNNVSFDIIASCKDLNEFKFKVDPGSKSPNKSFTIN